MTKLSLTELQNRKAIPACNKCGSNDVRCEAYAKWNAKTQAWLITELLDGNTCCNACGQDCLIKWRVSA